MKYAKNFIFFQIVLLFPNFVKQSFKQRTQMEFSIKKKVTDFKRNIERKMLVFLTLLSVFLILWIKLDVIPLIKTDLSFVNFVELNEVIVNLAYGLIGGYVFYLITVKIPENKRKSSTRIVIQDEINILHDRLIVLFMYFYKINGNNPEGFNKEDFTLETFGKLAVIPNVEMKFIYYRQADNNFKRELSEGRMKTTIIERKWHTAGTGDIFLLDFLQNESDYIHDLINNILSYPTISSQDDALIIALFEIRSSNFLRSIENSKRSEYKGGIQFYNDAIFVLYLNFKMLVNYSDQRGFSLIKKE